MALGWVWLTGEGRSTAQQAGIWAPEKTDHGDCWSHLEQVLQLSKRKCLANIMTLYVVSALFFQWRTIKAPSVQGNYTEGILVALCPTNTQSWIPLRNNPATWPAVRIVPRAALNLRQETAAARSKGCGAGRQGQRLSSSTSHLCDFVQVT